MTTLTSRQAIFIKLVLLKLTKFIRVIHVWPAKFASINISYLINTRQKSDTKSKILFELGGTLTFEIIEDNIEKEKLCQRENYYLDLFKDIYIQFKNNLKQNFKVENMSPQISSNNKSEMHWLSIFFLIFIIRF